MKKILLIAAAATMLMTAGCKSTCNCSDGPVAPESYSSERWTDGEPTLPFMIPWWKFQ